MCPQNGPYLYHYSHFFSFNYQNHTISYLAALYLFQSLLIQQDLQSTELTNRFFEKQVFTLVLIISLSLKGCNNQCHRMTNVTLTNLTLINEAIFL